MENEKISPRRLLYRELISKCRERGLSNDELIVIGAMSSCKKSVDKFGELEAIKIAIRAVDRSHNSDEVFRNVRKDLQI